MATEAFRCDPDQLRLSLEGGLPERLQAELEGHLERCAACRQELERMAAASKFWDDALLLRGDGRPGVAPTGDIAAERDSATEGHDENTDPESDDLGFLDPPGPDRPEMLGRLGAYEIVEVLGRGGMGIVLKARDPALDRMVAIKVLAAPLAYRATARRRFAREARAIAAVGHEHIVAVHAVDEFRGLPYIVMQYVPGRSLQDRLDASGPLELKEILRIGIQAAHALAAAHAQGVVHRDIKPANILLENCVERVKLSDFGLARAVDDASLTQSGLIAGTPQYMAPEQASGGSVTARADLFSLGAVLYAMASGRPPFRAGSALAVLKRVCETQHRPIRELNPEVPDWLEALIDRLLAKDPANRFESATDVACLLERGLAHLQQPATVPVPQVPAVDPPGELLLDFDPPATKTLQGRRRRLAGVAALLLLSAVVLGASEATGLTQVSDFVATILRIRTPEGMLVIKGNDPGVKVQLDGKDLVITGTGLQEIRLRAGAHRLAVIKNGRPVREEIVSITRGGKEVVNVALEPADPGPTPVHAPAAGPLRNAMVSSASYSARSRSLIWSLDFSPDGRRLAIGHEGIDGRGSILRIWDLDKRRDVVCLESASHGYRCVAFSPDGRTLATGSFDGIVTLFDTINWKPRVEESQGSPINALAFLPDGATVVAGDWDGRIRFYNRDGKIDRPDLQYPDRVYTLSASADGSTLAAAGKLDQILVYDLTSGRLKASLAGHNHHISWLEFSPDGKRLASVWGSILYLWDTTTWSSAAQPYQLNPEMLCARFSRDGKFLAISDGESGLPHYKVLPSDVVICDASSLREVRRMSGHTNSIFALAFSPDGKTIASGSMDQTIKLWDWATGKLLESIVPGESGDGRSAVLR
jgi:hypothetical protein